MKHRSIFPIIFLLLVAVLAVSIPSVGQGKSAVATRIVVDQKGRGDFKFLQDAINSIRAFTPMRITVFVRNGVYREKIQIPAWITDIDIVGETRDSTIIVFNDHAGRGKMGTFESYTFRVEGNSINISDLTIQNDAGPVGQAVALHVEGDRVVFRNVRLLGDQDTLFASGEGSRQLYIDCYIEGTTDFIFGPATAWFENCQIHSKKNSYITAASTPSWVKFGYVFNKCRLTAASDVSKVFLGRPWRDFAKTVFIECDLGAHIVAEGWHNWSRPETASTTLYAEYNCTGPGAARSGRVTWSRALSRTEAAQYTPAIIFGSNDAGPGNPPWFSQSNKKQSSR